MVNQIAQDIRKELCRFIDLSEGGFSYIFSIESIKRHPYFSIISTLFYAAGKDERYESVFSKFFYLFQGELFFKSSLEDIIAIKNKENLDGGKNFLIDLLNFLQKIRVNY